MQCERTGNFWTGLPWMGYRRPIIPIQWRCCVKIVRAFVFACLASSIAFARQSPPPAAGGSHVHYPTPPGGLGDLSDWSSGGGSQSSSNCTTLCPYSCTYYFDTPLYKGYCYASIASCSGSPGNATCTCDGHGSAPSYRYGEVHSTRE